MRRRRDVAEVGRRLVHASGALVPALYLAGLISWVHVGWILSLGIGIAAGLEYSRLRGNLDWEIYRRLTREYEQEQVAGYALYMVGMGIVGLVFEPAIAIPAMLMLTLGDPIGGILGGGSPGRKAMWVQATMFGTCFLFALPFAFDVADSMVAGFTIAAAGGLVAALADGNPAIIRGRYVDDNLTIPIGAAIAMWVTIQVIAL